MKLNQDSPDTPIILDNLILIDLITSKLPLYIWYLCLIKITLVALQDCRRKGHQIRISMYQPLCYFFSFRLGHFGAFFFLLVFFLLFVYGWFLWGGALCSFSVYMTYNNVYMTLYNYWLVMRATYDMLDLKTKCCPRPKAEVNIFLKVQHITCRPNSQSIIVLLYLHWFRIKYSIQTIHKQTNLDQTGLNLDELI